MTASAPDGAKFKFFEDKDADGLLAWRTGHVDALVAAAHRDLLAGVNVALMAVGGYGRKQLFPFSDIDLLLLFDSNREVDNSKKVLAPFLQRLWDSGLRVSQSVRTPAECSELHERNIELNVSLLDVRFLAGSETVAAKLNQNLPRFIHGNRQSLIRGLALVTRDRRLKFNDTIHHLEPNIKETPGGLRDYQLLCWLSVIKNTTNQSLGSAAQFPELEAARKFLFTLRCFLHYEAGRDSNALNFDAQDAAAPH